MSISSVETSSSVHAEAFAQNEDQFRQRADFRDRHTERTPYPDYMQTADMQEKVKAPLEQRVHWIKDTERGRFSEHVLDSAIRIRTFSKISDDQQVTLWEAFKSRVLSNCNLRLKVGSGMLVATLLLSVGIIFNKIPSKIYETRLYGFFNGMLGVCGTVLVWSFLEFRSEAEQAEQQIQKWKQSPVAQSAQLRTKVYTSDELDAHLECPPDVLHPLERQALHEKYFHSFCSKMLNGQKEDLQQWRQDFLRKNPLNFEQHLPPHLQAAAKDYRILASITPFAPHSSTVSLQHYLKNQTQSKINDLENTKKQDISWEKSQYKLRLAELHAKRDYRLKDPELKNATERQNILASYKELEKSLQETLEKNIARICQECDEKIALETKFCEETLKLIDEQFDLLYYQAACELLKRAERAWKGEMYEPMDMSQFFPWFSRLDLTIRLYEFDDKKPPNQQPLGLS